MHQWVYNSKLRGFKCVHKCNFVTRSKCISGFTTVNFEDLNVFTSVRSEDLCCQPGMFHAFKQLLKATHTHQHKTRTLDSFHHKHSASRL